MLTYFLMILSISLKFSYASQACGNPNEPLYVPFGDTKEGKLVCPVKADEDKRKLEELSEQNYEMGYCLWEDMLTQDNENSCQYEVKPIFRKYENKENKPIRCSLDRNQFLHYFGYYYCGDEIVLERFRQFDPPKDTPYSIEIRKSRIIAMYNVCFDVNNNTPVWTEHAIETPQLFQDPSKKGTSSDVFLPQPLVPPDHFALRLGKKATNHYINRRPLWDKLVPLMTAIDQGIKKAAIKASLELPRKGPTDNVLIYTKTKTAQTMMTRFKKWFKVEPFEPNIWYKFVYDPLQSQGVIIYVHNTPGKSVVRKCGGEVNCNFKQWTTDEHIQSGITEEELKYAYCCPITSEEAKKEFAAPAKNFKIEDFFDINSMALH